MFKIVTNIANLPAIAAHAQERASDLVEDPTFAKIKRDVRLRAIESLARGEQALMDSAQIVASHSFERYPVMEHIVQRIGAALGLQHPQGRMQLQRPGVMATMHLDDLTIGYMEPVEASLPRLPFSEKDRARFREDPSYAVRFLIFLEDSKPGQGVMFEDQALTKWRAGDAVYWDWQRTAHSTFNTSFWDRSLVRITGLRSELTERVLQGELPQLDYNF